MKRVKPPLFSAPRLTSWRPEMQSSDWTYYGLTYAMVFGAFTSVGIAAMVFIGPSEGAEERRKNRRPMRTFDLRGEWASQWERSERPGR